MELLLLEWLVTALSAGLMAFSAVVIAWGVMKRSTSCLIAGCVMFGFNVANVIAHGITMADYYGRILQ